MENTVKQRLIDFLRFEKIGQNSFEKRVGWSNGYISNIKSSIGSDKLALVSNEYPLLNLEWLLTGKGEMIKKNNQQVGNIENSTAIGVNVNGNNNSFKIAEADILQTMRGYQETISSQQKQIEELTSIISRLVK